MKIIYSDQHKIHNPPFEIYDGTKESYAEKPERIDSIVSALKRNGISKFYSPRSFSVKNILNLHQKEYLEFIKNRSKKLKKDEVLYPSYFIQDTYTSIVSGTFAAAVNSVNIALTGAQSILSGNSKVYALCRPPGHHAEYKTMGGYCYFNNAAIAADYLSKNGKVAIMDIDFHHGNGTQSIFYKRADVFYVSIHADPRVKFPYGSGFVEECGEGKGLGFNRNYQLPLGITDKQYLKVLRKAINNVGQFAPKFLVVSAGFDTYEKDPIGGFKLTIPFYKTIGEEIAKLGLPTLIIQEGGYCVNDLGEIAYSLILGIGR
jgi:acetoin utilization deacetylase AcuC-like enzyme